MELYQHWEEATEATREDAAQLKRDHKSDARTSYGSLVYFTKTLAVGGCFDPINQLSELGAWLSAHRSEIPAEIEDERGNRSWSVRLDKPAPKEGEFDALVNKEKLNEEEGYDTDDYQQDKPMSDDDLADEHGLFYMGDSPQFKYFDAFCYADREYRTVGPVVSVRNRLMFKRGDLYRTWKTEQRARLRWRGMEEFRGVTKALVHMDAGVSPRAAQSGSAPLPSQAELHDLFNYDGLTLTWAVSRGRIRKGKPVDVRPQINGTKYIAGRLVWMHRTGEDPASATISYVDGDNSNLAWSNLRIERLAAKSNTAGTRERSRQLDDSRWQARFSIDQKRYTLGEYITQTQAEQAYGLAMRTFQRFA